MSRVVVAQVVIDNSTNRVFTGRHVFDRSGVNSGSIALPSGSSFPADPISSEIFFRSDEDKVYIRNGTNTGWVQVNSSGGTSGGDPFPSYVTLAVTSSLPNERVLTPGYGLSMQDGGVGGQVILSLAGSLSGSAGVSESGHKALRDLIHFINDGPADGFTSGAHKEVLGSPFVSSVTWYTSVAKTQKIVDVTYTRNSRKQATSSVWRMYDTDGSTILVTLTDTITYSNGFETSRTRTWA